MTMPSQHPALKPCIGHTVVTDVGQCSVVFFPPPFSVNIHLQDRHRVLPFLTKRHNLEAWEPYPHFNDSKSS